MHVNKNKEPQFVAALQSQVEYFTHGLLLMVGIAFASSTGGVDALQDGLGHSGSRAQEGAIGEATHTCKLECADGSFCGCGCSFPTRSQLRCHPRWAHGCAQQVVAVFAARSAGQHTPVVN